MDTHPSGLMRCRPFKASSFLFIFIGAMTFLILVSVYVDERFNQTSPHIYSSSLIPWANDNQQSSSSSFSISSPLSLSSLSSSSQVYQQPHQHVYYLKTHKTGSTTMFFIFAEYCRVHDLLPLMPRLYSNHINQKPPLYPNQLSLVSHVKKYDMVFNHHIFDPKIYTYLHRDTLAVTTLREPFDNFVSAFLYYRTGWGIPYLKNIPGEDPVAEYLQNPRKYEAKTVHHSFTNNRQSIDLGYDDTKGFDDEDYIKKFIHQTENRFKLVLITEYFDESLIIMKRALHWNTQDIVYLSKNKGKYYQNVNTYPEKEKLQRELHAKFSKPDIMLYDYFLKRFKERMEKEIGLQEEVMEFRKILEQFRNFCQYFNGAILNNFIIPAGNWTNAFHLTPFKCKWLGLTEVQITKHLQNRQTAMFQRG